MSTENSARPRNFVWTTAPTAQTIPDAPLKGNLDGRPFAPGLVQISYVGGQWKMAVTELTSADLSQHGKGTQAVYLLNLDKPKVGTQARMGIQGAAHGFVDVFAHANATQTKRLYLVHSYVLEIDQWNVKPADERRGGHQVLGQASGGLVVVFPGGTTIKPSWLAGRFNVRVVYLGDKGW